MAVAVIEAVPVAGVYIFASARRRSIRVLVVYQTWMRSSNIALNITDKQRQGAVKLQRVSEKEQTSRKMALNIAKIVVIKRESFNTKVPGGLRLRRTLLVPECLSLNADRARESAQTCLDDVSR